MPSLIGNANDILKESERKIERPVIGLTMYGLNQEQRYSIPHNYIKSIADAGGLPRMLPPIGDKVEQVKSVDGVLLIGGGDICPSHYNQPPHKFVYGVDVERDRHEIALTHQVIESEKPLFGICRGIQILNVALGGTLIQHLPDIVGQSVKHRLPPHKPANHSIVVDTNSRLADIVQSTNFSAPSWHHQALDFVADSLSVVAWAPDGTIEAVEMDGKTWRIAVQWHPEISKPNDLIQKRLFEDFVQHCRIQNNKDK